MFIPKNIVVNSQRPCQFITVPETSWLSSCLSMGRLPGSAEDNNNKIGAYYNSSHD